MSKDLFNTFLDSMSDEDRRDVVRKNNWIVPGYRIGSVNIPPFKVKNELINRYNSRKIHPTNCEIEADYLKHKEQNWVLFCHMVLNDLACNYNTDIIQRIMGDLGLVEDEQAVISSTSQPTGFSVQDLVGEKNKEKGTTKEQLPAPKNSELYYEILNKLTEHNLLVLIARYGIEIKHKDIAEYRYKITKYIMELEGFEPAVKTRSVGAYWDLRNNPPKMIYILLCSLYYDVHTNVIEQMICKVHPNEMTKYVSVNWATKVEYIPIVETRTVEIDNGISKEKEKGYTDEINRLRSEVERLSRKTRRDAEENERLNKRILELTEEKKKGGNELKTLEKEKNRQVDALNEENQKLQKEIDEQNTLIEELKSRKGNVTEFISYENEMQLIDVMAENARALNLIYNKNDLMAFHMSTKTSNLTILEGMSGTGKSQLINLYAKTLGLDVDNRLKVIAVSPAWTDDSDILGYLDQNTMTYREANTGLVSFLAKAEKEPEKLHLICFDEMNLAKVEYYFAQFLSVLENNADNRILTIYNKSVEDKVINREMCPAEIKLGKNLIFCGTINIDESTFRLSDKVLDRANMICLHKNDFENIPFSGDGRIKVFNGKIKFAELAGELSKKENDLLKELDKKLSDINPRFGIAFRVRTQINNYIAALPDNTNEQRRRSAMDSLIAHKILPKIRGTEEQIGALMGEIDNEGNYKPGIIDKIINPVNAVDYPLVRQTVIDKVKELKAYGYIG